MEPTSFAASHGVEDNRVVDHDAETSLPSHLTSSPLPFSPFPHSSSSAFMQQRSAECWICFDNRSTRDNPIVSHRCRCRGSVGFVHQKCIDRWVIHQHNRLCRSCGAPYQLVHSEYPPDAHLPLGSQERKDFLVKFFVRPLAKELAEAIACVVLRFMYAPLFLGIIYNIHRVNVLLWVVTGDTKCPKMLASNVVASPLLLWLFNLDAAAATSAGVGHAVCLSAWADTFLLGLVVCTFINAIAVASRKWNKYFKNARRQHEQEVAAAEAQMVAATAAAAAAAANVDPYNNYDGIVDNGVAELDALEQMEAEAQLEDALREVRFQNLLFPDPPMEGWRPEWGPVPTDDDFAPGFESGFVGPDWVYEEDESMGQEPAAMAEDDIRDEGSSSSSSTNSTSSSSSSDGDGGSDGGDDDSNSGEESPVRLSFVDELFDLADWFKSSVGGGGLKKVVHTLRIQLCCGVVLTLLLRCPLGRMAIALACVLVVAGWRCRYSRNVLPTSKRRFQEVAERVPLLPADAVRTLFYVYLVDAFFFYCTLPEMGGMMLHYALSPYIDIGMDGGLLHFISGLTVWKLAVYWGIGALLVMLLTAMELLVVSALFANGVELFFVRSFDARWDTVLGYWRCVITQVFDSDPPRIVYSFARVALVELLALLVFVRLPFWCMLEIRDVVWGDGARAVAVSESRPANQLPPVELLPTKMTFSMSLRYGYDLDQDVSFADWRRAEVLQVLDERVLMPFGGIYANMIGSHPSFLENRNMSAPIRMDPLVAAAMLTTNASAAEMWEQVWGNMSDNAVFTFDLIDPTSAQRVAELSEGFRETLARVRSPLEWLRQATLRAGVCDTLAILTAPTDWTQDASQRMPVVDMEGLIKPPNLVLPHPNASAARNRQMIFEAWQRAHHQASQQTRLVSHLDSISPSIEYNTKGLSRRAPRMHSVNMVNCYLSFLQAAQPFVRMGRWQTAATEWWSVLLLRNTFFSYAAVLFAYIFAFFTAVACFGIFPIQRAQLRFLLPVVQWIGRRVVHMEDYLFDAEQIRAVEEFVRADVEDELVLPPMVELLGFNRREDYIDDSLIPTHVVARCVVVSVLFFAAASIMVWTVPVLCGSLLMSFTTNALPVLLGATLMSFFIWSPTLLCRAVVFGVALTGAFFLGVPLLFTVYVAPIAQTFWRCYPTLVEETFQRHYNVRQTVGLFSERTAEWLNDSDGGEDEDDDDGHAGRDGRAAAGADSDDWESVDSHAGEEEQENDRTAAAAEAVAAGAN